jgi:transketolase
MRDHFVRELTRLAVRDPRIILVTGDLGFGVLNEYREKCPNQFINAGVAEQHMTGLATGMAMEGKIVFTYSIANFPTLRCLEQIRNDACYHGVNVNVVSIGGGFSYGALGISHHATEDLAIMRALPDITVLAPSCDWEAAECAEALVSKDGTGFVRLDKSSPGATNRPGEAFRIGQSRRLREGQDLTIITCGGILEEAFQAAEALSGRGIECRIVSMHSIKPLDRQAILLAASETGGILTLEEHTLDGGLGSAVSEVLMDEGVFPGAFRRMGLAAEFSSVVGSQRYLRGVYGLDARSVVRAATAVLSKKPPMN